MSSLAKAGKTLGALTLSKLPAKVTKYIQDNPLLVAVLFAISIVVMVFILYKFFKDK